VIFSLTNLSLLSSASIIDPDAAKESFVKKKEPSMNFFLHMWAGEKKAKTKKDACHNEGTLLIPSLVVSFASPDTLPAILLYRL